MIGLYMVLWGKSKEMKNVTSPDLEIEKIEVVVTPTTTDHDNINCSNNCCESNIIVSKDDGTSSKSVQEGQDIENNIKETSSGDVKSANNNSECV